MSSKQNTLATLEDILQGLNKIGRDRVTVLSHSHTFELVDDLIHKVDSLKNDFQTEPAASPSQSASSASESS